MSKYLHIISVANGTGDSYCSLYHIKDNDEITLNACRRLFEKDHQYNSEYLYFSRGDFTTIDIEKLVKDFKVNEKVVEEIEIIKQEKVEVEKAEIEQLKKLKAKYPNVK